MVRYYMFMVRISEISEILVPHDVAELLLMLALNATQPINQSINQKFSIFLDWSLFACYLLMGILITILIYVVP